MTSTKPIALLAMDGKSQWGRSRSGFTLLELLVVIAILSLLISMITGSMGKARESAKSTKCLSNLRSVYMANAVYVDENGRFPDLNNDPKEGAWQYNYLIYDGRDFEQNWGPIVDEGTDQSVVESLFCPMQEDPFHTFATPENPWPVQRLLDTRAAYGRRYHLSGRTLSDVKGTIAFAADVFHLPDVVRSAHRTGVNVAYMDGHVDWVRDRGLLTDNELAKPFDPMDNDDIRKMWEFLDRGRR